MQGYCQSAQRTQSTALFTCFQRADLEQQVTRCGEASAPKAHRAASLRFPFPPAPRRVGQGEEGPEQPALLQLRHPHQLQDQKRGHEPQDVVTGPRPCGTRGTRGQIQQHRLESKYHQSQNRTRKGSSRRLTQGIDAFAPQEHVGKKVNVEI